MQQQITHYKKIDKHGDLPVVDIASLVTEKDLEKVNLAFIYLKLVFQRKRAAHNNSCGRQI